MQRRSLFAFLVLTAIISAAATFAVLSFIGPQSQGAVERLVTFEVLITATTDPLLTPAVVVVNEVYSVFPTDAKLPYLLVTATIPNRANLPTDIFETPNLTRSPVPTINPTVIGSSLSLQSTATALPQNCILHTIEAGDTPFGIAAQYGTNGFTLMAVNGLTEETATQLRIGDVLIVPLEGCPLEAVARPTATPTATSSPEATQETTQEVTPTATLSPTPTFTPTITLAPTSINAQVSIVEVLSPGDITEEGVRIRNTGNTINVTGWTLSDIQGNVYTFPEQLLFSNAEVTVYTRAGQNTPVAFFWNQDRAVWGDPGDVVTLADKDGRIQATLRLPSPVELR